MNNEFGNYPVCTRDDMITTFKRMGHRLNDIERHAVELYLAELLGETNNAILNGYEPAYFMTKWAEGTITTTCYVNRKTKHVADIEISDEDVSDFVTLEGEYVLINGEQYECVTRSDYEYMQSEHINTENTYWRDD